MNMEAVCGFSCDNIFALTLWGLRVFWTFMHG